MAPNNPLPIWGNEKTMNMNPLILTNIQSSPYFKVNLYELKTYHEVIDEIYYKVEHLEPWEKGSRKTAGQTGMCGGVRGVGAGGIVSSAYCLLYKLFTLKLTAKQVNGLITHKDSPYIRGLGFMFIRYTQDPKELWDWFEPFLEDEEEIDVKAGGGHVMTMGEMVRQWLVKLEWYSTLFPRIPVPVQKTIMANLKAHQAEMEQGVQEAQHIPDEEVNFGEAERQQLRSSPPREARRSPPRRSPRRSPPRKRSPDVRNTADYRRGSPDRRRSPPPRRRSPDHDRRRSPAQGHRRSPNYIRRRSPDHRSSDRHRRSPDRRSPHRSSPRRRHSPHEDDFARDLLREKERQQREKESSRHRSRSVERRKRSRSKDRKRRRSGSRDKVNSKRSHKNKRSRSRSRSKKDKRSRSRSRSKRDKRSRSGSRTHDKRSRSRSKSRKEKRSSSLPKETSKQDYYPSSNNHEKSPGYSD